MFLFSAFTLYSIREYFLELIFEGSLNILVRRINV